MENNVDLADISQLQWRRYCSIIGIVKEWNHDRIME